MRPHAQLRTPRVARQSPSSGRDRESDEEKATHLQPPASGRAKAPGGHGHYGPSGRTGQPNWHLHAWSEPLRTRGIRGLGCPRELWANSNRTRRTERCLTTEVRLRRATAVLALLPPLRPPRPGDARAAAVLDTATSRNVAPAAEASPRNRPLSRIGDSRWVHSWVQNRDAVAVPESKRPAFAGLF